MVHVNIHTVNIDVDVRMWSQISDIDKWIFYKLEWRFGRDKKEPLWEWGSRKVLLVR